MITLNFDRPKLNQTLPDSVTLDVDTPVVSGDDIEIRFFLDNVLVDNQVINDLSSITWDTVSPTITGGSGTFSSVRPGDVISSTSGTDFTSGQIVTDVSVTGNTVTLDAPADGNTDSGQAGSSLTFTPGTLDTTLFILKLTNVIKEDTNILQVRPTVSTFTGTKSSEGTSDDDDDNLTFDDGRVRRLATLQFDLDQFLTNVRKARVN